MADVTRGTPLGAGTTVPSSRYYTDLGRACDYLLRCKDCRTLVRGTYLAQHGCCPCGNRRVVEVTALSWWEYVRIRVGLLRFPYRREFLREFGART